jgi:large subunit ribosomal protein L15
MKFNQLSVTRAKSSKRVGRGISAGRGKTAGRGTKGQGSRKSGGVRPGFEGGQMPLYMRIPKLRGFRSNRTPVINIYTNQLDELGKSTIDTKVLADAGLIENPYIQVKLVLKGDVTKKINVKLQSASKKATEAVAKAGGKFEKVEQVKRPAKKTGK